MTPTKPTTPTSFVDFNDFQWKALRDRLESGRKDHAHNPLRIDGEYAQYAESYARDMIFGGRSQCFTNEGIYTYAVDNLPLLDFNPQGIDETILDAFKKRGMKPVEARLLLDRMNYAAAQLEHRYERLSNEPQSFADIMDEPAPPDSPFTAPWTSLQGIIGPKSLRPGHMVLVQAEKKVGKTTICLALANHFVETNDAVVLFDCLEMTNRDLADKVADSRASIAHIREHSSFAERLFFHGTETFDVGDLLEVWDNHRQQHGTNVFFLDNLQFLVDGWGLGSDGRASLLSQASKAIRRYADQNNVLVFLITQARRLEKNMMADSNTIEGSSGPAADCSLLLTLSRTQVQGSDTLEEVRHRAIRHAAGLSGIPVGWSDELIVKVDLNRFGQVGETLLRIDGESATVSQPSKQAMLDLYSHIERQKEEARMAAQAKKFKQQPKTPLQLVLEKHGLDTIPKYLRDAYDNRIAKQKRSTKPVLSRAE